MADKKISALPAATTPLAGTEVLPVVQSGATDQVSVANLTAGRAVSALSLALTGSPLPATSGGTGQSSAFTSNGIPYATSTTALTTGSALTFDGTNLGIDCPSAAAAPIDVYQAGTATEPIVVRSGSDSPATVGIRLGKRGASYGAGVAASTNYGSTGNTELVFNTQNGASYGEAARITYDGNLKVKSGQGIDFSATPGTGTSELFADYEEGDWTPVVYSGGTDATMNAVTSGKYTKIGRVVNLHMWIQTTTLNGIGGGQIALKGLPFTVNGGYAGYAGSTAAYAGNLLIIAGQSVALRPNAGATTMGILIWSATTGTATMTGTQWTDTGYVSASISYLV
jgi:hypothetical protein